MTWHYPDLTPVFPRDVRSLAQCPNLTIDGESLADLGCDPVDGVLRIGEATAKTSLVEIPGASGAIDLTLEDTTGRAYEAGRTIEIDACIVGGPLEATESKLMLAGLRGRIVDVSWADLPGVFRGRMAVGAFDDTYVGIRFAKSLVTLTLTTLNPHLIGPARSFGAAVTKRTAIVEGTRETRPVITAIPPADTRRLYITVNDSMQLAFNLEADGSKQLVADCTTGRATYGGQPLFPSIDSEYPILIPGENTVQTTAGEATFTYNPLYAI